jgi:hypothetical protein
LGADGDEFKDELESGTDERATALLDAVAGGDYWRPVIDAKRRGDIDGGEAERRFAELYRARLAEEYRYVLSMPIRVAAGQPPKFRLIHATNHPAGCVLMAENMSKRTEDLYIHLPRHAQISLLRFSHQA